MDRIIRAVLEGEEAVPGRVAAADVARLVLALQTALRRTAYVVLGRPRRAMTGRYEAAVEDSTRLRFVGVEAGSFANVLALPEAPDAEDALDIDVSFQDLGYRSFHRLLDALERPSGSGVDPTVASAIAQLADDVNVGGRTTRVRLESLAHGEQVERRGLIDEDTRRSMREIATSKPEQRRDVLYGRLMEADFEQSTARLRQPTGEAVVVTFGDDLADAIKDALRESNTFAGEVTYDSRTGQAVRVLVRAVVPLDAQLAFSGGQFRRHRTVTELAQEQGIHAPQNLDALHSTDVDDEELAAFVAAAEQS